MEPLPGRFRVRQKAAVPRTGQRNVGGTMTQTDLTDVLPRVDQAIAERREELVDLVAELVRRPSLLGDEAVAQAYVAEQLRHSGMTTEVWDLDDRLLDHPEAGRSGLPFAGRPDVAGILPGGGGGRSLILN